MEKEFEKQEVEKVEEDAMEEDKNDDVVGIAALSLPSCPPCWPSDEFARGYLIIFSVILYLVKRGGKEKVAVQCLIFKCFLDVLVRSSLALFALQCPRN